MKKNWVLLYRLGYDGPPIHRRYPATERRGNFWLLPRGPGPVRSSLDNLETPSSPGIAILTPSLARTPDRHRSNRRRAPSLKPSSNSCLHSRLDYRLTPPSPATVLSQIYAYNLRPDAPPSMTLFDWQICMRCLIVGNLVVTECINLSSCGSVRPCIAYYLQGFVLPSFVNN